MELCRGAFAIRADRLPYDQLQLFLETTSMIAALRNNIDSTETLSPVQDETKSEFEIFKIQGEESAAKAIQRVVEHDEACAFLAQNGDPLTNIPCNA